MLSYFVIIILLILCGYLLWRLIRTSRSQSAPSPSSPPPYTNDVLWIEMLDGRINELEQERDALIYKLQHPEPPDPSIKYSRSMPEDKKIGFAWREYTTVDWNEFRERWSDEKEKRLQELREEIRQKEKYIVRLEDKIYDLKYKHSSTRDDIPTDEPDEHEKKVIKEYLAGNPEYQPTIPQDEAMRQLGITL